MMAYASDVQRLVRDLEKQGVEFRLTSNNRYTGYLPNGVTFQFSLTNSPTSFDQQRKKVIDAGIHWPLDPKPRTRKASAPKTSEPEPKATPAPKMAPKKEISVDTASAISTQSTSTERAVTPQIAEEWLEKNPSNRKLSDNVVKRYARMMTDGQWHYDASPIRFDTEGNLLDGQHRLWAIIESGTTQRFLVVTGLSPHAFTTIDTGKVRSFKDVLSIQWPDQPQQLQLAAVTNVMYRWEEGLRGKWLNSNTPYPVTNDVLLQFLEPRREHFTNLVRSAASVQRYAKAVKPTALAIIINLFESIDKDDSDDFFAKLTSGAGMSDDHPVLVLRNTLYRYATANKGRGMPNDQAVALFIKAWNAYRKGDTMRLLAYKSGGATPEAFPVAV